MKSYPDWVPAEVVSLYASLCNGEFIEALFDLTSDFIESHDDWRKRYYASHRFRIGLQALGFAIESKDMEKAWKAIERRKSKAAPDEFALLILRLPGELEWFSGTANKDTFIAWGKLADDLQAAAERFTDTTGEAIWPSLVSEIREAKAIADHLEREYYELDTYVGQRSAESAPRIYLIRRLAETIKELYGSPLYETVSATAALILDEEPLDSDHIRKIVVAHGNRPKPWWWDSRPEEIQETD